MRQFNKVRSLFLRYAAVLLWAGVLPTALAQVLVSSEPLTNGIWKWSRQSILINYQELKETPPEMPEGTSILAFRLKYKTKNLRGETVVASGLVRVRSDFNRSRDPLPVVSYQHSTRVKRENAPSTDMVDPEGMGGAVYFASRGYLWAMPDYLGLGVNEDPQMYLHAHGQAVVCADFLLAVEEWAQEQRVSVDRNVIVMGYSQGGHATLALQKYLESAQNHTPFTVRASFPMAGPYSVAGVELEHALETKSSSQLLFVALALYGLSADPSLNVDLSEVISEEYSQLLPDILSGKTGFSAAAGKLPRNAAKFFTPQFLASVLEHTTDDPMVKALMAQDVVDFKAKAPVYLIHAPDDKIVLYDNSVKAAEHLKANGSKVRLITMDAGLSHEKAALPAFSIVAKIVREEIEQR